MKPDRATRADVLLRVALVWTWGGTGGYFWSLALGRGAVLPGVPRAVWAVPGWLWAQVPALAIALLVAATYALARWAAPLRKSRPALVAALALVIGVALLWGGALLAELRS